MKRKPFLILLAIGAAILTVLPVLATATYIYNFTLQETGGISYTLAPVYTAVNNTALASGLYISSSGLDTRITSGGNELKRMLKTDSIWFASPITASRTVTDYYTFGNMPDASMPYILGNGGYVTVADAAALEPGVTYQDEISGYFEMSYGPFTLTNGTGTFTGSPKSLVVGANTVACTVAGTATISLPTGWTGTAASGTMTVTGSPVALVGGNNTITTTGATGNITVTVNNKYLWQKGSAYQVEVTAANTLTAITTQQILVPLTGGSGWTNSAFAYDNNLTTYATYYFGPGDSGYLTLSITATLCNAIQFKTDNATYADPITLDAYYDGGWVNVYTGSFAGSPGTFTKNLPSYPASKSVTQVRIKMTSSTYTITTKIYEVYLVQSPAVSTTVTSGAHTVKITGDSSYMKLYLDNVEKASAATGGSTVTDNASNWIAYSMVMPRTGLKHLSDLPWTKKEEKYAVRQKISGEANRLRF